MTSTSMNASRRKFVSSPKSAADLLAQMLATKTSLMQQKLNNKLLSPVATTSRRSGNVTSPTSLKVSKDPGHPQIS